MTDRTKTICPPIFDLGGIIIKIILVLQCLLSRVPPNKLEYKSNILPVPCFICSFKGNRKNIISLFSLEGYTRVINENKNIIFLHLMGCDNFLLTSAQWVNGEKDYINISAIINCFALALLIPCIILEVLCCSSLRDIFGSFLFFVFIKNLNLLYAVRHVPCAQYLLEIRPCGSGGDEIWTFSRYYEAIPLILAKFLLSV